MWGGCGVKEKTIALWDEKLKCYIPINEKLTKIVLTIDKFKNAPHVDCWFVFYTPFIQTFYIHNLFNNNGKLNKARLIDFIENKLFKHTTIFLENNDLYNDNIVKEVKNLIKSLVNKVKSTDINKYGTYEIEAYKTIYYDLKNCKIMWE